MLDCSVFLKPNLLKYNPRKTERIPAVTFEIFIIAISFAQNKVDIARENELANI